jgi:FixJ family two-component response regulator
MTPDHPRLARASRRTALTLPRAIAIVDDDDLVRSATASLVRALGFSSRSFASAVAYLEADTSDIACVISDVQMPELSGIQLQQRLAQRGDAPPLLLMTAFPDERLRAQALGAGAVAFLEKPIDGDALLEILERALVS